MFLIFIFGASKYRTIVTGKNFSKKTRLENTIFPPECFYSSSLSNSVISNAISSAISNAISSAISNAISSAISNAISSAINIATGSVTV